MTRSNLNWSSRAFAVSCVLMAVATSSFADSPDLLPSRSLIARPKRLGSNLPAIRIAQIENDDDLLAPLNLNSIPDSKGDKPVSKPSATMSASEMEDYLKDQEERAIRAERAKLEARARFEARSRDLIPKPPATSQPEPVSPTDPGPRIVPADDLSPPLPSPEFRPRVEPLTNEADPDMRGLLEQLENIPSPSDQLFQGSPRESVDDEIPPPLRPTPVVPRTKAELNTPEDMGELPRLSPILPKKERTPSAPAAEKAETAFEDEAVSDKKISTEDDFQENASSPLTTSVLQTPASMIARAPISLPEDHFVNWPTPYQHRYAAASNVHCPSCGGCVDRDGEGCYDEFKTYLGVEPCLKPSCQCWRCPQAAPFNLYGPGSYAGPARPVAIPEYRLRAGDSLQLTFMIRSVQTDGAYRLVVGDELLIESEADEKLTRGTLERGLEIQPDGTISLRFIGEVHAAGRTIDQLRDVLNDRYERYYPEPSIDVTPVKTGSIARQIREAISGSEGFNAQTTTQVISPEGTIRLPRIGAVPAQGLTLGELKREINLRYSAIAAGLEVEPNLQQQAPHYVYVLGEVVTPGRFVMDAPTSVLGAIALAGGHVPGGNLRQVVVFRRGPNWELYSTLLDLRSAYLGKDSQAVDEIWIQDNDVIIIPPSPIRLFDRFVTQVFTEGIYGIVPFGGFSYTLGDNQ